MRVSLDVARSALFAPGSAERKVERAIASDADLVVLDLEDAVPPAEKARARVFVAQRLAGHDDGRAVAVRVNGRTTPWFRDDLEALAGVPIDAIVVPKADTSAVDVAGALGAPVIALVETAAGVRDAYAIAERDAVAALALGAADLGAELWLEHREDGHELSHARATLTTASAAAERRAPFDGVQLAPDDDEGLERSATLARSLGFRGKLCIHPRQVPIVNRVFTPSAQEVDWAREVTAAHVEAAADGRGALTVAGALVDEAIVRRARRILAAHGPRAGA